MNAAIVLDQVMPEIFSSSSSSSSEDDNEVAAINVSSQPPASFADNFDDIFADDLDLESIERN